MRWWKRQGARERERGDVGRMVVAWEEDDDDDDDDDVDDNVFTIDYGAWFWNT